MSVRNERVADLYMEDRTSAGNPSTEGLVRYVTNDLVAFLDGEVKSLTEGTLPTPVQQGAILFAVDATAFVQALPVIGPGGWLVTNTGLMIVTQ